MAARSTHAGAVDCLLWWAVTQGRSSGVYDPGSGVTRGQMASFLVRLLQRTGAQVPDSPADRFPDDDGSTHEANINRLAALEITGGYGDGKYRPDQQVPRDQMASFLVRVAEKQLETALPAGADAFGDDSTSTHQSNINKAAAAGLTGGTAGGGYDPAGTVRRDQMASFLTRLLDLVVADRLALARVVVAGLPDGTPAPTVTLTSAADPRPRPAAGTGVVAVPAGEWALTGADVVLAGQTWTPVAVPAQTLAVGVTRLPLTYSDQPLDEGDLAADVVPLPEGTPVTYEAGAGTVTLPPGAVPADLAAGDVLIARPSDNAPDGVLARVLARSEQDGQVVLATEPATLMDAYPAGTGELDLQVQDIAFDPAEGVTVDGPAATAKSPLTRAAELNVRGPTLPLRVDVKAGLDAGFGREDRAWDPSLGVFAHVRGPVSITPTIQLEAGWTSASAGLGLETRTDLDISVGASVTTAGTLNKVFERKLGTARAYGCASLVCATLTGEIFLTVSVSGELRWDFRATTRSSSTVGLVTDRRGTRPTFDADITVESLRHQRFTAQGTVEAFAGGDLALKLYAVAGPYVKVGPYAQLKLTGGTNQKPTCTADGGLRGVVGLRAGFKILGKGFEASVETSRDFPLRTSSCGGARQEPSPEGPGPSNPSEPRDPAPTAPPGADNGRLALVSRTPDGTSGNSESYILGDRVVSADGRYVAFSSASSDLVAGDTNDTVDVFLFDRTTGTVTLVSRAPDGTSGNRSSGTFGGLAVSADGRYVVFGSSASDLVAGDTDGDGDVFLFDRTTGTVTLVSRAPDGTSGNRSSGDFGLVVSADGRYVVFGSYASDLVAGDTNGDSDVFLFDRTTGTVTLVSRTPDGTSGNSISGTFDGAAVSADGRYVVFGSYASDLVAGDTNGDGDVFLFDRTTGQVTLVSRAPDGTSGNRSSGDFGLVVSADGRYVVFSSYASDLVAGDTNGDGDVFLFDRTTGQVTLVSRAPDGTSGNSSSGTFGSAVVSADGRYVVFGSYASDLVAGDTNGDGDVFLFDRTTGQVTLVSRAPDGTSGNRSSGTFDDGAVVSADGRYVVFDSYASDLVAGDTNGDGDVFLFDRTTGQVTLVSRAPDGTSGNSSSGENGRLAMSADGRYVVFDSFASDLVAGDTNDTLDVFLYATPSPT